MKVSTRYAKSEQERLVAAVNSADEDIFEDVSGRIVVTGRLGNGDRIYLGDLDPCVLYQKRVNPQQVINHVRFAACARK